MNSPQSDNQTGKNVTELISIGTERTEKSMAILPTKTNPILPSMNDLQHEMKSRFYRTERRDSDLCNTSAKTATLIYFNRRDGRLIVMLFEVL